MKAIHPPKRWPNKPIQKHNEMKLMSAKSEGTKIHWTQNIQNQKKKDNKQQEHNWFRKHMHVVISHASPHACVCETICSKSKSQKIQGPPFHLDWNWLMFLHSNSTIPICVTQFEKYANIHTLPTHTNTYKHFCWVLCPCLNAVIQYHVQIQLKCRSQILKIKTNIQHDQQTLTHISIFTVIGLFV